MHDAAANGVVMNIIHLNWTLESLRSLISDQVEESLILEYKAAAALSRTDAKKAEITKDISFFANSAGGTIIYGMREFDLPDKKHLPATIDPIDRSQFSKEWLEQIINNIRPRIENILIYPVSLLPDFKGVVFVVEIPQSTTAHQAVDLRYYKRFNFESVPMYDYEIRDVLSRNQHPRIILEFDIVAETNEDMLVNGIRYPLSGPPSFHDNFYLHIRAYNSGSKYAHYFNALFLIPASMLKESEFSSNRHNVRKNNVDYVEYFADNASYSNKFGPIPHNPILPNLRRNLETVSLVSNYDRINKSDLQIEWTVYADNATPGTGSIAFADIQFTDHRSNFEDPNAQ